MTEAVNKLTKEIENSSNPYVEYIGEYLIDYIEQHPWYAKKILEEGKSIQESLNCLTRQTGERGIEAILSYFNIQETAISMEIIEL